jgi:DNA repair ATPase RecN
MRRLINMQTSRHEAFKITPAIRREIVKIIDGRIRESHVTKEDFSELKGIVADIGKKVGELAEAQKELAEAQKRTEIKVEELAEAQKELAEAQKRTEIKVEELAEAQKRTEIRVEELAEAQKRTEHELKLLTEEHRKTRKEVGGLSLTAGYRLEDEAYKALPALLKKDYGIVIKGKLKRGYVKDNKGMDIEVNIIGECERDGKRQTIIGEGKSQLSKNDIDRFINNRVKRFEGIFDDIFPVIVTYMISTPDVEEYAKQKGVVIYYSYDF